MDTSTAAGRMMTHMLGAFAEFERGIIRERSIAGQTAAMMRGIHCGSQKKEAPVWSADQAIRELNMALEEEDHAPVAELVAGLTKVQQLEVANIHKADWSAGKLLCKGTEIQKLRGLHRIIADNFEADDWQSAAFILGSSDAKLTLADLAVELHQLMHG